MNNSFTKYIFVSVLFVGIAFNMQAQLSMFNKIDTFKGFYPKVVPLDKGFLLFNNPQWISDTTRFRLSKFNECGDLDWTNDYSTKSNSGISRPDVIKVYDDMYLLLKSPDHNALPQYLTLVKLNILGDISWARNFNNADKNLYTNFSNILRNGRDVLYIITSDKQNNTIITSLNTDGDIIESKKLLGIKHRSSIIDSEGNLVIFSDSTSYAKVHLEGDVIDTLMWAKEIEGRYFADIDDPVVVPESFGSSVISVVVDTLTRKDTVNTDPSLKLDTAIYRLVKFDTDGNILLETKGFLATDFKDHQGFLKVKSGSIGEFPVYFMVKDKVCFYSSILEKMGEPLIYKFAKDSFDVYNSSLEICEDNSLVMSGFCYKKLPSDDLDLNSPYLFVSKTQPADRGFKVESEEPVCLEDSTDRVFISLSSTNIKDTMFSLDTVEMNFEDIEFNRKIVSGFNEEKCGKVNMDLKPINVTLCPGQDTTFSAPYYKGASYKWSTGSENPSISVDTKGEYTVTVTLCDTIRDTTFVYQYIKNTNECFSVLYPNAFFPSSTTDTLNRIFKVFQKKSFDFEEFEMKIFDRWGEKLFETTDFSEGWDGTFRGKDMPPGVYLYHVYWKVKREDQEYEDNRSGQILLLR